MLTFFFGRVKVMKRAAIAVHDFFATGREGLKAGFTLMELLITVAIIGIISSIAIPALSSYYGGCCVTAVICDITGMIKEAKQNALANERYYAVSFNPAAGRVSLLSGRGPDGKWNTDDDEVIRAFRLADKGGGLRFSHGSYGPIPDHAVAPDGVAIPNNNTLICNPDLTGNAGTVYIMSASGAAMALMMNSTDYGYKMYRWSGGKWARM
jgi:prepilin-type N-terminal cleavage/methylation domain-containing protein